MQVHFLGTGGFHPNERRHTACIMLPEIGLIFDAGSSAFRIPQLLRTKSVDLFLTHAHLDHICGLTYLITPVLLKQLDSLHLYGRKVVLDAVRDHLFHPALFPVPAPFEFHEIPDDGHLTLGSGPEIEWMKLLSHPGHSTAFKVRLEDHVLAYVTDTTVDGSYAEFLRDVETLIHECYFPDAQKDWAETTGHTHATPLAELAKEVGVGRLIVVHSDPLQEEDDVIGLEGMRAIFSNIEIADDGLTIDLSS